MGAGRAGGDRGASQRRRRDLGVSSCRSPSTAPPRRLRSCLPEAAAAHARVLRECPELLGEDVRLYLEVGALRPPRSTSSARCGSAGDATRVAGDAFAGLDAVVAPTLPATAPPADSDVVSLPGGEERVVAAYLRLARPSASSGYLRCRCPAGSRPVGLPIGLQLIGRPFGEATLLRIGRASSVRRMERADGRSLPVTHRVRRRARDQVADLYVPDGDGPFPVAVVLHGGFWRARFGRSLMHPICCDLQVSRCRSVERRIPPARCGWWLAGDAQGRRAGDRRARPARRDDRLDLRRVAASVTPPGVTSRCSPPRRARGAGVADRRRARARRGERPRAADRLRGLGAGAVREFLGGDLHSCARRLSPRTLSSARRAPCPRARRCRRPRPAGDDDAISSRPRPGTKRRRSCCRASTTSP